MKPMTKEQRVIDFMVTHIIYHRTIKALKCAQWLREHAGMKLDLTLNCATGYRERE